MHSRIFILLSLLASLAVAEPLNFETATRLALETNPELAAARELIAEAEARASGLGRLPNPELETEAALGRQGRARLEVGLSQTFPRASRLRLERRVADESLRLARLEVAAGEQALAARTHLAMLDLAGAEAAQALAEKQAALAREFADAQAAQARSGQVSALDAAQADLFAREAELAVAIPRAKRTAAAWQLAGLLSRETDAAAAADIAVAVDLALPPDDAAVPPAGLAAEAGLAGARRDAADAEVALARSAGRDGYTLGVFVEGEQDRDGTGGREHEALLGLRFSVPLPVRDVAAPLVAEKQAARRRLALEHEARVLAAANDLAAGEAEIRARHAVARAIAAELLPATRAHLVATEAAHARGEIDSAPVFRARERLTEIERSDLDARLDYHRAVVRRLFALSRSAL